MIVFSVPVNMMDIICPTDIIFWNRTIMVFINLSVVGSSAINTHADSSSIAVRVVGDSTPANYIFIYLLMPAISMIRANSGSISFDSAPTNLPLNGCFLGSFPKTGLIFLAFSVGPTCPAAFCCLLSPL